MGCALVLLVLGWRDILATDWAGLRPLVWVTLFYLSVMASSITVLLVQFATMRLPSSKVCGKSRLDRAPRRPWFSAALG